MGDARALDGIMTPRAWIFSDMHLDANRQPFSLPKDRPECDMVICSGDICEGADRAIDWLADQRFGVPVVYVLGNHEFYRGEMRDEMEKAMAAADRAGIHWLDCSHVDIGTTRVIGATLWTDYRLDGEAWRTPAMIAAGEMMNDHRLNTGAAPGRASHGPARNLAREINNGAGMDHEFNFTHERFEDTAPGHAIKLTADLNCVAEIGPDDIEPGEWVVEALYVSDDGGDPHRIAPGSPLHAALMNHVCGELRDEIDERFALRHPQPRDCGYGHLHHERL